MSTLIKLLTLSTTFSSIFFHRLGLIEIDAAVIWFILYERFYFCWRVCCCWLSMLIAWRWYKVWISLDVSHFYLGMDRIQSAKFMRHCSCCLSRKEPTICFYAKETLTLHDQVPTSVLPIDRHCRHCFEELTILGSLEVLHRSKLQKKLLWFCFTIFFEQSRTVEVLLSNG